MFTFVANGGNFQLDLSVLMQHFTVFGYARRKLTDEELREMISKTLTCRIDERYTFQKFYQLSFTFRIFLVVCRRRFLISYRKMTTTILLIYLVLVNNFVDADSMYAYFQNFPYSHARESRATKNTLKLNFPYFLDCLQRKLRRQDGAVLAEVLLSIRAVQFRGRFFRVGPKA